MHLDGFPPPVPRFANVAPLTPAQLQARLARPPASATPAPPPPAATAPLPPSAPRVASLPLANMAAAPVAIPEPSVDAREVFRRARQAVWTVVAIGGSTAADSSQGSAVAVAPRMALTACHVVLRRELVLLVQGQRILPARVAAQDDATDRCILEATEDMEPVVGVRAVADLEIGERIFTLATPRQLDMTFADGIVSAVRMIDGVPHIQTTAAMAPGSSGGAVLDARGNLIGIIVFRHRAEANLGFAVAADSFWRN
jgi:serine protease Do